MLKDAASNALYGARGANGVIMITTKHAQKGKAAISLDAKWGSNSSAYVNYDYITDPAQYYELYYKGLYNYYTNSQGQTSYNAWKSANSALVSEQANGGLGEIIYSVPSGQSLIGQNGKLNPQATLGNVVTNNGNQYLLTSYDWRKAGIKTGLRQEYNMSINGGDDLFQFYGSGSYLSNEGITNGADFKRYNGMMKIDYQARKWLKIGGTARFIHTNSNSNNYAYYGSLTTPCIYPVYVRDASSRFSPDHRWGNFWSLGGAWIMNKEPWFPKTGWIDQLKLKASYGEQGNDNIGEFRYTDFYKITTANGKAALSFSQKGKDDITWEKNGNFNAGIDFELFNHRVTGSLEYYHRKTTDMLLWFTTPVSIGYTGYYDNVGDMVNKGVEFSISGDIIRKKDFNWNVNFNISHNKNKVTYLPDENKIINMEGHAGYRNLSNYNFVGEGLPLYTWYMPKYAGPNSQGQSTWYVTNADGTQSTTTTHSQATYYLCGDANPKVYGGFGTTVSAYGFDLTASFLYSLGGKGIDYGYQALMGSATSSSERGNLHKDLLNAWTADNTTSTIPRFQYGDENSASMSNRFLTSNNSLTFKNISLGYTFPRRLVEKLKLTSLRIYCSCDNVYYWTKRKGYDPRTALDGQVRVQDDSDLNFTYYQPIRTISGGITVKF